MIRWWRNFDRWRGREWEWERERERKRERVRKRERERVKVRETGRRCTDNEKYDNTLDNMDMLR